VTIRNRFTQAYKVQHPFVVAGLGLVGMTPDLAVAACEAGAIGSVGHGMQGVEQVGSTEAAQLARAMGSTSWWLRAAKQGGHNHGQLPTFVQVPTIVDAVAPVPVLAAGGIVDGRGVAAALALGPTGCGSGLGWSPHAREEYKRRLVAAAGTDTIRSSILGPDMPNSILIGFSATESSRRTTAAKRKFEQAMRLNNFPAVPEMTGVADELAMPTGEGVGLIQAIEPTAAVIRMMADAEAILMGLATP
jgi:enoyl-[acyl-carrier protein] reductase II